MPSHLRSFPLRVSRGLSALSFLGPVALLKSTAADEAQLHEQFDFILEEKILVEASRPAR